MRLYYKKKISPEDFCIPKYKDYNDILNKNYNKSQLKNICKFYKQKISGNKSELKKRNHIFLRSTYYSIIIQKNIRRYFVTKFFKVSGPAFNNYSLCTNACDFLSLLPLTQIRKLHFFSIEDTDKFIYGFNFKSIYNLYLKSKKHPKNPYNRKLMPNYILQNIKYKLRLSKILNIDMDLEIRNIIDIKTDKIRLRTLTIFQKMDELGNYTNVDWFLNLNKLQLMKFMKELEDIWNYRAQLTPNTKKDIIPPNGKIFTPLKKNEINIVKNLSFIQTKVLNCIDKFVSSGVDNQSKALGSFYVLGSLTLVNKNAAEALPWLYESMIYNI